MEPKYSILLCNQELEKYKSKISEWLSFEIKVLWFSTDKSKIDYIKAEHSAYEKAFLFLAYEISIPYSAIIVDENDKDSFVEKVLADECSLFNSAHYLVEHCKASEHIIVQASAGTGKTTVMIDRIMYLLHTNPDLHLSEVYMITFTNDAADQMNRRLQDTLMMRYKLIRQQKYLRWVEEQS